MKRARCTGTSPLCERRHLRAFLFVEVRHRPACLLCQDDGWRDFGIVCVCFAGRLRLSALGYTGDRAGMAFDPTGMPFALYHGFPCCVWFARSERRCADSRCAP